MSGDGGRTEQNALWIQQFSRALGVIFFFSGMASLLYQVAWQRLLGVYYGVGPLSSTLIVTLYMLGLGFGALLGGTLAERWNFRAGSYRTIELCLGVFGLLSLPLLDSLGKSTAGAPYGVAALCMASFLAIPTLLMGMTLPILVKTFTEVEANLLKAVGFLYFVNTLGAAFGALTAAYGVISFLGLDWAVYFAVGLNFLLALSISLLDRLLRRRPAPLPAGEDPVDSPPDRVASPVQTFQEGPPLGRMAFLLVGLTGFVAIGYELVWFRIVELLVKASPYAFSTVLFVYLTGIAFGCRKMNLYLQANPTTHRRDLFFRLQGWMGLYILGSLTLYYYVTRDTLLALFTRASFVVTVHPLLVWPRDLSSKSLIEAFASIDIFLWPVFFLFVPTLLMGASFPLISVLAQRRPGEEGGTVGRVYFFNTLGNVLGGACTGYLLLPQLGTERTLLIFGLSQGLLSLLDGRASKFLRIGVLAGITLVFPSGGQLYRVMHLPLDPGFSSSIREGVEGVVFTAERGDEVHNYINGLAHGFRPGYAFYAEALEALAHARRVDNVLIIGFGTGSVYELVARIPEVKHITVVELNRTLMENLNQFQVFQEMLAESRLELVIDDGRRYLTRSPKSYDLILIDPLRSTTAYSNNLYSQEFFALCASRLTPGGIFMLWMDEHRILPGTLAASFKKVKLFNYFALASSEPLERDPQRALELNELLSAREREGVAGVDLAVEGDETTARLRARGLPLNADRRPVTEYYLGRKVLYGD